MVVVNITEHAGNVRAYEMRSVLDEPVALQISGATRSTSAPVESRDLTITASVGRFGDRTREQKLVADIRKRLAEVGADPYGSRAHPDRDASR